MTLPDRSTSAPPELPGLISALAWMAWDRVTPLPSDTLRLTDDTMPWVTLDRSPSGLPIASEMSPARTFDESPKLAGSGVAPVIWMTARSLLGSAPTSLAACRSPFLSVTTNLVAPLVTCALVTTSPSASYTIPDPSPRAVSICTTVGDTSATTSVNCFWTAATDPDGGRTVAGGAPAPPHAARRKAVVATTAIAAPAPSRQQLV